jgi:hypothetical protein
MPFYCGKRSAGICVVLGPKKSSTYSSEYASGFFEPAASHLPASRFPRNEGLLGQTPSRRYSDAPDWIADGTCRFFEFVRQPLRPAPAVFSRGQSCRGAYHQLWVFLQTVLDFVIIAFVIVMVVKQVNRFKKPEAPPAPPSNKHCPYCCLRFHARRHGADIARRI